MANETMNSVEDYTVALERIEICRKGGGRDLDLQGLGLKSLPPEIFQLKGLVRLRLDRNGLTTLPPEIGQLTALRILELDGNRLTTLPPEIGQLTALQVLDLDRNNLTMLPPEIGQLKSLELLYLSKSELTTLPPEIGQLSALRVLVLRSNQLTALPPEIGQLLELKSLVIAGNPLPAELLKLSEAGLLRYLRELSAAITNVGEVAVRRFDEAKLLLVGPGDVGKTWLLTALQGNKPARNVSTKGIEVARQPLTVQHPTNPERPLRLNCWDFGGQDHYQITHQIFFSAMAIYLLVWKPRAGIDPDLISRLERIQLSAGQTAKGNPSGSRSGIGWQRG